MAVKVKVQELMPALRQALSALRIAEARHRAAREKDPAVVVGTE